MNLKLNTVPNAETIDKQQELFDVNPAANDTPGSDGSVRVDPAVSFGKRALTFSKSRLIKDPLAIEDAMLEERSKPGERSFGGLFFSILVVAVVAMHLLFAWILEKRQDDQPEPRVTIAPVQNRVLSSSVQPTATPVKPEPRPEAPLPTPAIAAPKAPTAAPLPEAPAAKAPAPQPQPKPQPQPAPQRAIIPAPPPAPIPAPASATVPAEVKAAPLPAAPKQAQPEPKPEAKPQTPTPPSLSSQSAPAQAKPAVTGTPASETPAPVGKQELLNILNKR